MSPAQPNLSLINGLACLQTLAASPSPLGSREMARLLDLEPTRVNRLLGTLAHLGLAEQTRDRKYRPGPGIHVLAAQSISGSGLLAAALPHLEALRSENLMVALGVLWKRHVCYVFNALPGDSLQSAIGPHRLFPVEKSSIGLSILASRDERALQQFVRDASDYGDSVSRREVEEYIRFARNRGYVIVGRKGAHASLGVPLGNPAIAGIAFSGDMQGRRIAPLVKRLKATASAIAADMET
ncbi:MAG: helix-turn-helix domain-containing protein [Planctomycetes bacterium]|nr:helix-turn-helix domain-containing protein [Planctomycetota bacterium]